MSGDFPGFPAVKTAPPFQCKGTGLILDWGTKISHASGNGQIKSVEYYGAVQAKELDMFFAEWKKF